MTKKELVMAVCNANPHIPKKTVEEAVECFFEAIKFYLAHHQRVELRGFGSFSVRTRPAHKAHNPKTGKKIDVPEKFVPFFRASQILRNKLKNSNSSDEKGKKSGFFSLSASKDFPFLKRS
jgi:integration host factor subunit beta